MQISHILPRLLLNAVMPCSHIPGFLVYLEIYICLIFVVHHGHSAATGAKRRGGPGGLSKVCSVSRELQAIVGEPTMSRTEV